MSACFIIKCAGYKICRTVVDFVFIKFDLNMMVSERLKIVARTWRYNNNMSTYIVLLN